MKRISIYLLGVIVVLAGCTKKSDDLIQGQTVDQRLTAALAAYQTKLTSATYGWIMVENSGTPSNGGQGSNNPYVIFAYYMQFNDQNKVIQFSDFDTSMLVKGDTSSFRLKAMQRPTLIFDTYSYIHVPCDPDASISKSPLGYGLGWGTDFEFEFADSVPADQIGDTILLTGLSSQNSAMLIRATKAQHDMYTTGKANVPFFNKILNYFKHFTYNNITFEITPAANDGSTTAGPRNVDISYVNGGRLNNIATGIYYVGSSIFFTNPIGGLIKSVDNIVWNPATQTASATVLGLATTINGAIAPVQNNVNNPWNWWVGAASNSAPNGSYWQTNGIHINGVDDALHFSQIANYYGNTAFFPIFDTVAQPVGIHVPTQYTGLVAPLVIQNNALNVPYGPINSADFKPGTDSTNAAPLPPSFKNGLYYFNFVGDKGTVTGNDAAINTRMRNVLTSGDPASSTPSMGWYLVLKDDGVSYDMVSTTDAKTWIKWR